MFTPDIQNHVINVLSNEVCFYVLDSQQRPTQPALLCMSIKQYLQGRLCEVVKEGLGGAALPTLSLDTITPHVRIILNNIWNQILFRVSHLRPSSHNGIPACVMQCLMQGLFCISHSSCCVVAVPSAASSFAKTSNPLTGNGSLSMGPPLPAHAFPYPSHNSLYGQPPLTQKPPATSFAANFTVETTNRKSPPWIDCVEFPYPVTDKPAAKLVPENLWLVMNFQSCPNETDSQAYQWRKRRGTDHRGIGGVVKHTMGCNCLKIPSSSGHPVVPAIIRVYIDPVKKNFKIQTRTGKKPAHVHDDVVTVLSYASSLTTPSSHAGNSSNSTSTIPVQYREYASVRLRGDSKVDVKLVYREAKALIRETPPGFTEEKFYSEFVKHFKKIQNSQLREHTPGSSSTQTLMDSVQKYSVTMLCSRAQSFPGNEGNKYIPKLGGYSSAEEFADAVLGQYNDLTHIGISEEERNSPLFNKCAILLTIPMPDPVDHRDKDHPNRISSSILYTCFSDLYNLFQYVQSSDIAGCRTVYADGTVGILNNNTLHTMITFGGGNVDLRFPDNGRVITTSLRPFVHCLTMTEHSKTVVSVMGALQNLVPLLFGGHYSFCTDIFISDYSSALRAGVEQSGTQVAQTLVCYPHIRGSFTNKGTTWKAKLVSRKQMLPIQEDISCLHRCMSECHMYLMFPLQMQEWKEVKGEEPFAIFFDQQYGPSSSCQAKFHYSASRTSSIYGNNNPSEAYFRSIKGSPKQHGIPSVFRKQVPGPMHFFPKEAKKHVAYDTYNRAGMGVGKDLLRVTIETSRDARPYNHFVLGLSALMGAEDLLQVDSLPAGYLHMYYVNSPTHYGCPITTERVQMFQSAVEDIDTFENRQIPSRNQFTLEQLKSIGLTRVDKVVTENEIRAKTPTGHFQADIVLMHQKGWFCSCMMFWKELNCPCVSYVVDHVDSTQDNCELPARRAICFVRKGYLTKVDGKITKVKPPKPNSARPAWARRRSKGIYHPILEHWGLGCDCIPKLTYIADLKRPQLAELARSRGVQKGFSKTTDGRPAAKWVLIDRLMEGTALEREFDAFVKERGVPRVPKHGVTDEEEKAKDNGEDGTDDAESVSHEEGEKIKVNPDDGKEIPLDSEEEQKTTPPDRVLPSTVILYYMGATQSHYHPTINACTPLSVYVLLDYIKYRKIHSCEWFKENLLECFNVHLMIASIREKPGCEGTSYLEVGDCLPEVLNTLGLQQIDPFAFMLASYGPQNGLEGGRDTFPSVERILEILKVGDKQKWDVPVGYLVQRQDHTVSVLRIANTPWETSQAHKYCVVDTLQGRGLPEDTGTLAHCLDVGMLAEHISEYIFSPIQTAWTIGIYTSVDVAEKFREHESSLHRTLNQLAKKVTTTPILPSQTRQKISEEPEAETQTEVTQDAETLISPDKQSESKISQKTRFESVSQKTKPMENDSSSSSEGDDLLQPTEFARKATAQGSRKIDPASLLDKEMPTWKPWLSEEEMAKREMEFQAFDKQVKQSLERSKRSSAKNKKFYAKWKKELEEGICHRPKSKKTKTRQDGAQSIPQTAAHSSDKEGNPVHALTASPGDFLSYSEHFMVQRAAKLKLEYRNLCAGSPAKILRANVLAAADCSPWESLQHDKNLKESLFWLTRGHSSGWKCAKQDYLSYVTCQFPNDSSTIWAALRKASKNTPYSSIFDKMKHSTCPQIHGDDHGRINSQESITIWGRIFSDNTWLSDGAIDNFSHMFNRVVRGEALVYPSVSDNVEEVIIPPRLVSRLLPEIDPKNTKKPVVFLTCGVFQKVLGGYITLSAARTMMRNKLKDKRSSMDEESWQMMVDDELLHTFDYRGCSTMISHIANCKPKTSRQKNISRKTETWLAMGDSFFFPCNIDNYHWVTMYITLPKGASSTTNRSITCTYLDYMKASSKTAIKAQYHTRRLVENIFKCLIQKEFQDAGEEIYVPVQGVKTPIGKTAYLLLMGAHFPTSTQVQNDGWSCGHRVIMSMWTGLFQCWKHGSVEKDVLRPKLDDNWKDVTKPAFKNWLLLCTFNSSIYLPGFMLNCELLAGDAR